MLASTVLLHLGTAKLAYRTYKEIKSVLDENDSELQVDNNGTQLETLDNSQESSKKTSEIIGVKTFGASSISTKEQEPSFLSVDDWLYDKTASENATDKNPASLTDNMTRIKKTLKRQEPELLHLWTILAFNEAFDFLLKCFLPKHFFRFIRYVPFYSSIEFTAIGLLFFLPRMPTFVFETLVVPSIRYCHKVLSTEGKRILVVYKARGLEYYSLMAEIFVFLPLFLLDAIFPKWFIGENIDQVVFKEFDQIFHILRKFSNILDTVPPPPIAKAAGNPQGKEAAALLRPVPPIPVEKEDCDKAAAGKQLPFFNAPHPLESDKPAGVATGKHPAAASNNQPPPKKQTEEKIVEFPPRAPTHCTPAPPAKPAGAAPNVERNLELQGKDTQIHEGTNQGDKINHSSNSSKKITEKTRGIHLLKKSSKKSLMRNLELQGKDTQIYEVTNQSDKIHHSSNSSKKITGKTREIHLVKKSSKKSLMKTSSRNMLKDTQIHEVTNPSDKISHWSNSSKKITRKTKETHILKTSSKKSLMKTSSRNKDDIDYKKHAAHRVSRPLTVRRSKRLAKKEDHNRAIQDLPSDKGTDSKSTIIDASKSDPQNLQYSISVDACQTSNERVKKLDKIKNNNSCVSKDTDTAKGALDDDLLNSSRKEPPRRSTRKMKRRQSLGETFRELVTGDSHVKVRDFLFDLSLPPSPSPSIPNANEAPGILGRSRHADLLFYQEIKNVDHNRRKSIGA